MYVMRHLVAASAALSILLQSSCTDGAISATSVHGDEALAARIVGITVRLDSSSITAGNTTQARANLFDRYGRLVTGPSVTWTSNDPAVASVDVAGLVTGRGAGAVRITGRVNRISSSAPLTVVAAPIDSTPPADSTPPSDSIPGTPPGVTILFHDSFETGTLGFIQNGISWIGNAWVDVSGAIAHSGSRAARFRQGESLSWSELRFGGLPNLTEAFIQFYLYYPSGQESPYVGPRVVVRGTNNDKFFRLWGTADSMYSSDPGNKVGASIWGDGTGVDGTLGIEYEYSPPSPPQWGMGQGPDPLPQAPFVNDSRRGRWIQVRIRCKAATSANNDGVIQIWADGQLLLSATTLQNYPYGGPNTYTNGYLLGYANNGFAPGQYTYIDDVTISVGGFPQ
jgi:hypothetical protein